MVHLLEQGQPCSHKTFEKHKNYKKHLAKLMQKQFTMNPNNIQEKKKVVQKVEVSF
jgi:hypothetical protein